MTFSCRITDKSLLSRAEHSSTTLLSLVQCNGIEQCFSTLVVPETGKLWFSSLDDRLVEKLLSRSDDVGVRQMRDHSVTSQGPGARPGTEG